MKLIRTRIENFRSIKKCVINHNKITALVGKNNSGKSSVLRALNDFFNYKDEEPHFKSGAHQYSNSSHTRIELTFKNVPDNDTYNELMNGDELSVRMTYSRSTGKRTIYYRKNGKYNPISESFIKKLNEDITFILIPIDRDNKEVIWNENSLLKLLLHEYFEKSTSKRDNLTPKVKKVASDLERTGLKKIQEAIEKKYTLNKDFKFVFSFDEQIDYTLLLDQVKISWGCRLISGSSMPNKEFCRILNIPLEKDIPTSRKNLLIKRKKAIKNVYNLLRVLERLPDKNLPHSYIRIKKFVRENLKA